MTLDGISSMYKEDARRTAFAALLWCVLAVLIPLRLLLKLFALPFLIVAEWKYRTEIRLVETIGDIQWKVWNRRRNEQEQAQEDAPNDVRA